MSDRKIPFCKVYETEGGQKVIGFPTEITDDGDVIYPGILSVSDDIDIEGRAAFLNRRAARWLELNRGGSDE